MKNKGLRLILLFLLTAAWFILIRKMTTPLNPASILEFEFIGTAEKAENFLTNLTQYLPRLYFSSFIWRNVLLWKRMGL
jgi:hypothetical protein